MGSRYLVKISEPSELLPSKKNFLKKKFTRFYYRPKPKWSQFVEGVGSRGRSKWYRGSFTVCSF